MLALAQVRGLRGVYVSDRDGVPILSHSSLQPSISPLRYMGVRVRMRAASVSQGAACVSTRGACARMTAAHQDAVRV